MAHCNIGINNPMFGIHQNHKGKLNPNFKHGKWTKKYYCLDCRKEISKFSGILGDGRCSKCNGKFVSKRQKGRKYPEYSRRMSGDNNPSKRIEIRRKMSLSHGGTGIPYEFSEYPEEYFRIRPKILKRDNYICQLCFKYGNEPHHIDYIKQNNDESNLICLCHSCNVKVNKNRNYWTKYFKGR